MGLNVYCERIMAMVTHKDCIDCGVCCLLSIVSKLLIRKKNLFEKKSDGWVKSKYVL